MSDERVHILAEQGDLGLWDTPVSAEEQKVLNEQSKLDAKKNETDNQKH